MISIDSEICTDLDRSSRLEWLETNGIGGFACSTVSGINTRRYHGLLTAAIRPPLGRITILSKFEEVLKIDGKSYEISANKYPDSIHPEGFMYLRSFRLDPFPVWTYKINDISVERKIFMVYGSNATVCQWSVDDKNKSDVSLELKPMLSFVGYHSLQTESSGLDLDLELEKDWISVTPVNGLPQLFIGHNAQEIRRTGHWYRNFEYTLEQSRGFDFHEDLFQPFSLTFDFSDQARVIASTEKHDIANIENLERAEVDRRATLIEIANAKDDLTKQLALAADKFIVSRGDGKTIIAGYPWFSDWGRDTMISLSGLTLATNREGIAKNILSEFSNHISQGMIPNRFPDEGEEPEYNTVDATLWYFEAIRAYTEKTGDYNFVEDKLYEKLVEIIYWHQKGTRFNIRVEKDGLLYAGKKGSQLTWMDAKDGNEVFTPRIGKAVEIQALWYNALKIMEDLADRFGDQDGNYQYREMAAQAKKRFNKTFWNREQECLFDVVTDEYNDASIRPNQIFAVSLKHSMLSMFRAKKVVQNVEKELFTPLGLRSLSPGDQNYRSIYKGSPYERDSAYHQGTVWAWLMGAFITSVKRVYPNGRKSKKYVSDILKGFNAHLKTAGIGQISEIFDADEPHIPRGCFAQAWSVAEILRVIK